MIIRRFRFIKSRVIIPQPTTSLTGPGHFTRLCTESDDFVNETDYKYGGGVIAYSNY